MVGPAQATGAGQISVVGSFTMMGSITQYGICKVSQLGHRVVRSSSRVARMAVVFAHALTPDTDSAYGHEGTRT